MPLKLFATGPQFSAENEYIYRFKFKEGYNISNDIILYQYSDYWYLPFYNLGVRLGLNLAFSPELGKIEGDILKKDNSFSLSIKNCDVKYHGKRDDFDCNVVVLYENEVYVRIDYVEKWLPLKINIDSLKQVAIIETDKPFPLKEKIKRSRKKTGSLRSSDGEIDYGNPHAPEKYYLFDGLFIDQNISFTGTKNPSAQTKKMGHQTKISGQVLGFETLFRTSGEVGEKLTTNRYLNFKKHNQKGTMLEVLEIKNIELNDIAFPSQDLVGGGSQLKGVSINNFSAGVKSSYSKHNFQGFLKEGWEVELYSEDVLLDRRESNESGRYEFKNLDLKYGRNKYKLIFYGPHGEEKIEHKTIQISQKMLKSKKLYYQFVNGKDKDDQRLNALILRKRLSKKFTSDFSHTQAVLDSSPNNTKKLTNFINMSLHGFAENSIFTTIFSKNFSQGNATQFIGTFLLTGLTSRVEYSIFSNYQSALVNVSGDSFLEKEYKGSFNFSIPFFIPISTRVQLKKQVDDKNLYTEDINIGMSMSYRGFYLNNIYSWDSTNRRWKDSAFLRKSLGRLNIKLGGDYSQVDNLISYSLNLRRKFGKSFSINSTYSKQILSKVQQFQLGVSNVFDRVRANLNLSYDSDENQSISIDLDYGAGLLLRAKRKFMNNSAITSSGNVSISVFHDLNHNMIQDEGEPSLPNVAVRIIQSNFSTKTDNSGTAFVSNLIPYKPYDAEIDLKELSNIDLRSLKSGIRFWSKPGTITNVELPMGSFGDVEGTIYEKNNGAIKAKNNIILSLIDSNGDEITKTNSDSDGYYIFQKLIPGKYKIVLYGKKYKNIQPQEIIIPQNGGYLSDQDIILPK